jgi:hypothetical protein
MQAIFYIYTLNHNSSNYRDAIPGLQEGLEQPDSGVVSVYHPKYCTKTWETFHRIKSNPATYLFTFPPTVLKCAGAPQKIMWILEDTLRKEGKRDGADLTFCTPVSLAFHLNLAIEYDADWF